MAMCQRREARERYRGGRERVRERARVCIKFGEPFADVGLSLGSRAVMQW